MKLFLSAITKYLLGVLLVGFLLFLPAGSLSYSGGWLLMGLLFGPMLLAGLVMGFRLVQEAPWMYVAVAGFGLLGCFTGWKERGSTLP